MEAKERESLIRRYEEGPARLRAAYEKVPPEARQWRPGPGRWSAHEVVCHCADSETNAAMRIRYLVAEKDTVVQGYDQDEWAKRLDYHEHPIAAALAAVDAVRANTAPLLRRFDEAAWARVARHTESGRYSAEDWLLSYAEHLEKHSAQIGRNLDAWRARHPGRTAHDLE
jgi:hypothetical protein